MEKAIEKAIEGGYKFSFFEGEAVQKFPDGTFAPAMFSKEFLDPLFWQCLGKSLGWSKGWDLESRPHNGSHYVNWLSEWHKFIDHLAEGKDPEEFFNNLMK